MISCSICNAPEAEPHFGGISCRACAAFFRRYFHSKKTSIKCTCKQRGYNSHPCRSCRVQKCLSVGMTKDKVQGVRDRHSLNNVKSVEMVKKISQSLALRLPMTRITSRATPHITWTAKSWADLEEKRALMYGGKFTELNIFQTTRFVKKDNEMTWQLVEEIFPQTEKLASSDKYALMANFVPKWWQLEPVIDHMMYFEKYEKMGMKEFEEMVIGFYEGAFAQGKGLSREEIVRIFKPIWGYYVEKLILPIAERNFDNIEFMAILWLLFFDAAYTNISEDAGKICENIRKVILRELRGYQVDKNLEDSRIVDAMETLPIVERAVGKFEEELLICEMNGVQIHEDFQEIMKVQRI